MKCVILFIFQFFFSKIVIEDKRAVIENNEIMNILYRKAVKRKFGLNIFIMAPLYFLNIGHIDRLLLYIMNICCFLCFHYSVCALQFD